ncbi:DUF461 domain-containing protein [Streptomyces sp. 4N509B]|uniref:DUF461 domain-containing protein n=1 Tax=Streptomyces sp. 4N509B TaxID=3457413 RepID=UPI003FCFBCFB
MSSSLRRGISAATVALSLAALVACGAGADAETNEVEPDQAWAQVEDIKVQNVTVVVTEEGQGLAGINARLFNDGARDQTLEAINLPGTGQRVELTSSDGGGTLVVPAGGELAIGGEGNASAVIADPAAGDIRLGNAQRLVFDLSETGGIGLRARVVGTTGEFEHFADWVPAQPEPEPTLPEETENETPGEGTDEGAAEGTEGTEGAEGTEGTEGTESTEGTGADPDATDPDADADADGTETSPDEAADGGVEGGTGDTTQP